MSSSNTSPERPGGSGGTFDPVRLGIMGGTFDPVHLGHVAMAEAAAGCAHLDRVLLVPAGVPPHRGQAVAPARDRLEMCRLAAAGHPRLEVCDVELRRPGPSFTIDTLRLLHAERPEAELHLVLGWDAARDLASWRQPAAVQELARLVIVNRPGLAGPTAVELSRAGIRPGRAILCGDRTPAIDATQVRRRLASGGSLEGLLDPAVGRYLASRRLYRA